MTRAEQQTSTPGQSLAGRIDTVIREQRLLKDGQSLLVAVSGGVDSMVLLHILHELAPARGWKILVAHFNHQLRGRSSDADEKLVVRVAGRLGLRVVLGRADVKSHARARKLSIEMAARELRHAFLASSARRHRLDTVVLAHHAGDQAELFFLRLLRGTGTEGLAGMRPVSCSPADRSIRVVRPLLEISRSSLEKFAGDQKIPFRHDASNFDDAFLRNRIRRKLLPLLKEYQPGVEQTVARLMETARAESDLVGSLATEWLRSGRKGFDALEVAVQRRCLAAQLIELGTQPEFDLIEWLRTKADKPVTAAGGRIFVRPAKAGTIRIIEQRVSSFNADEASFNVKRRGKAVFDGARFSWDLIGGGTLPMSRAGECEFFDADAIGDDIVLRHWRPGDRFQPIGMLKPIKLQDFLTNLKVPKNVKVALIVAEDSRGRIFWVEGCRISEAHKVNPETRKRFKWTWARPKLRLRRSS